MSDKIIIIDFEDSFTFNIANILFAHEKKIKVISHQEFFRDPANIQALHRRAVILGPGPGHPEEYAKYFEMIKELMNNPYVYVMGICLGHQMMAMAHGLEVRKSKDQVHGQSVEIYFNGTSARVQRYNSLAVVVEDDEISICEYKNAVSYQFHPESIGTTHNLIFFNGLLRFVQYE